MVSGYVEMYRRGYVAHDSLSHEMVQNVQTLTLIVAR